MTELTRIAPGHYEAPDGTLVEKIEQSDGWYIRRPDDPAFDEVTAHRGIDLVLTLDEARRELARRGLA